MLPAIIGALEDSASIDSCKGASANEPKLALISSHVLPLARSLMASRRAISAKRSGVFISVAAC